MKKAGTIGGWRDCRMKARRMPVFLLTLAPLVLGGCDGMRLYNETKAGISASAKKGYVEADVFGLIAVQSKNLDSLHAEDLKVARENLSLQRDYALLRLADGDFAMAQTLNRAVLGRLKTLGFGSAKEARQLFSDRIDLMLNDEQAIRLASRIKQRTGADVPSCAPGKKLPDSLTFPDRWQNKVVGQVEKSRANGRYTRWRDLCAKHIDLVFGDGAAPRPAAGDVVSAKGAREKAQKELSDFESAVEDAKKAVDGIAAEHKAAVEAAKKAATTGADFRKQVKESADKLQAGLKSLPESVRHVLTEERIKAIATLLQATAGEQVDVAENPELATAVLFASGASSLSADIAQMTAAAEKPSVGNLLIELQHQVTLQEHAMRLQALQERRVEILRDKYDAVLEEARLLISAWDAACSYAALVGGKEHPGLKCNEFTYSDDGGTCRLGNVELSNCALGRTWKETLKGNPKGPAGREFYKMLASYMRVFPVRARFAEGDFHLVDLKHRENLATREMALKSWNNLAAVPIDQLEAYYKAGIKPAEISDLLIKALGFTAITVGVSQ